MIRDLKRQVREKEAAIKAEKKAALKAEKQRAREAKRKPSSSSARRRLLRPMIHRLSPFAL